MTDIEREAIGRANKFRECVKCGKAWNCRYDGEPCPACEAPAAPPIQPVIETAGDGLRHAVEIYRQGYRANESVESFISRIGAALNPASHRGTEAGKP